MRSSWNALLIVALVAQPRAGTRPLRRVQGAELDHAFVHDPPACASAELTATVLYRPLPLTLSRERGWNGRDYVSATTKQTVALP